MEENHSRPDGTEGDLETAAAFEKIEPVTSIGSSIRQVETNPYGARPECFKNTLQECLFVLTTTFAIGQSSILSGAITCITAYIGNDLNMNAAQVTWINAAQLLTAGSFLLFFGRVADLFGRRSLLLLSLGSYAICLLVTGFATTPIFMDVFCGLLGLCCAAAVPPAIGKLGAVYEKPSRRKNRAFACFSAGNPVGFAIGGFISGVTMAISTWRAAFWTMAVIYAAFTLIAWFTVPVDTEQRKGGWNKETIAKFDFLGAFLAVVGVAMFTAGLTLPGQAPHGWRQDYVIALIVIGVAVIAAFLYWQSIFKYPIMPLHVWRDRNFSLLVFTLCLGFYGFLGNTFWVALYWQRIEHLSPLFVAIRLLPAMIGGVLINAVAGMVMHRVSNKLLMAVGALGMVVASALYSAMRDHASYWAFAFPALICSVIGADFEFTVVNMYVMSSLPREQQSVAGGMFNTVSRVMATVGLGIQTGVFDSLGGSAEGQDSLKYRPYQATFWVSLGGAGLALFLVPWLTIKLQGEKRRKTNPDQEKTAPGSQAT